MTFSLNDPDLRYKLKKSGCNDYYIAQIEQMLRLANELPDIEELFQNIKGHRKLKIFNFFKSFRKKTEKEIILSRSILWNMIKPTKTRILYLIELEPNRIARI